MSEAMDGLTEEENDELQERPITSAYQNFTDEQLELRRQIAKKLRVGDLSLQPTLGSEVRQAMELCPPALFYESTALRRPLRAYGAFYVSPGVTGGLIFTLDGSKLNSQLALIRPIDRWTDAQKQTILDSTERPGVFLDPLGYRLIQ